MTKDHQTSQPVPLFDDMTGVARTLYISDSDRRKRFCLQIKLFYDTGRECRDLGEFSSKPLRVISKPTRKKASVANTDMCVDSGSEIALFNRIRSQAGSTRYLTGSTDGFKCSTKDWNTLRICNACGGGAAAEGIARPSGETINYGAEITLECVTSGMKSAVYVICKVRACSYCYFAHPRWQASRSAVLCAHQLCRPFLVSHRVCLGFRPLSVLWKPLFPFLHRPRTMHLYLLASFAHAWWLSVVVMWRFQFLAIWT
jgi:hypothetical protein